MGSLSFRHQCVQVHRALNRRPQRLLCVFLVVALVWVMLAGVFPIHTLNDGAQAITSSRYTSNYSLFVLANDPYMKFLDIFLRSLHVNADMDHVSKIFVGDIGVSSENKDRIVTAYPKIEFLNSRLRVNSRHALTSEFIQKRPCKTCLHGNVWVDAVSEKTRMLEHLLLNRSNVPIIMIDNDHYVVKDFVHLIDTNYDIQLCRRKTGAGARLAGDGGPTTLDYIASFLVVNRFNKQVRQFFEDWIRQIENFRRDPKVNVPYETPALCVVIEQYKRKGTLKIGDLKQEAVSSVGYNNESTHIVHMKSDFPGQSIDNRIDALWKLGFKK